MSQSLSPTKPADNSADAFRRLIAREVASATPAELANLALVKYIRMQQDSFRHRPDDGARLIAAALGELANEVAILKAGDADTFEERRAVLAAGRGAKGGA